jgi:hypothetical protein
MENLIFRPPGGETTILANAMSNFEFSLLAKIAQLCCWDDAIEMEILRSLCDGREEFSGELSRLMSLRKL